MNKKYPFNPDYGVHPGELLRDELKAQSIEPDGEMQAVLDGGVLSDALAERLEGITGLRAHVWKNLMRQYYEWALRRINEIWDPEGIEEREELSRLMMLVEAYEDEHYPIDAPPLAGVIEFWQDQRPGKVEALQKVINKAKELWEDGELVDWLYEKQKLLNGESAIDLIIDGRTDEVLKLIKKVKKEINNNDMFKDERLVYISSGQIDEILYYAFDAGIVDWPEGDGGIARFKSGMPLYKIAKRLLKIFTPQEAAKWMRTEQKLLGGMIPLVMILDGRVGEIMELLDRMEAGA